MSFAIRRKEEERGYILITAIWLLLLAGVIATLLTLRSMNTAVAARGSRVSLDQRLALQSAIETVLADRAFKGQASQYWAVPATASLELNAMQVQVSITSESGRLDVNEVDIQQIERALQGLAVAADERAGIINALQARRAAGGIMTSFADLRALLAVAHSKPCLEDYFTIVSGLPSPRPGQMPSALASALADPVAVQPMPTESGAAIRLVAQTRQGARLKVIARTTGLRSQPLAISHWEYPARCN